MAPLPPHRSLIPAAASVSGDQCCTPDSAGEVRGVRQVSKVGKGVGDLGVTVSGVFFILMQGMHQIQNV